jgi:hypothetical protein
LKTTVGKNIMNSELIQSTPPFTALHCREDVPAKKQRVKRVKKERTEEQITADKEKMAKLRAMRGKKKENVVPNPLA